MTGREPHRPVPDVVDLQYSSRTLSCLVGGSTSKTCGKQESKEEERKSSLQFSFFSTDHVQAGVCFWSLLSPWEPQRGGSAVWRLCYTLALIKGKYASLYRASLFICGCDVVQWWHAIGPDMYWCCSSFFCVLSELKATWSWLSLIWNLREPAE